MEIFILLPIILLALLLVIVAVAVLVVKKIPWVGLFFAFGLLISLPIVFLFMARVTHQTNHQEAISTQAMRTFHESRLSQQAEIQKRIRELEKQLEEQISIDQPPASADDQAKESETVDAEKTETADENKKNRSSVDLKKKLEIATQDLEKEKKRLSTVPNWLQSDLVIEQKNLHSYLTNPQSLPRQFVVSSGRFTTTEEASAEAKRMAKQLIEACLASHINQSGFTITEDQIRLLTINNYSETIQVKILDASNTSMHREHLLVDIGVEYLEPLMPDLRKSLVKTRIIPVATGLLGIMLASGLMSIVLSEKKK